MSEFIDWLRRQIDEDERLAKTCTPGHETWRAFPMDDIAGASIYDDQWRLLSGEWYTHNRPLSSDSMWTSPAYIDTDRVIEHIARHDPARVLREVEAKRQLLAHVERELRDDSADETTMWMGRTLAGVYRDRPGWREEWGKVDG